MSDIEKTKIYVPLLEEETPSMRGTQAEVLGDNLYKILAEPYYNPDDEIWQFPPGTIVRGELRADEEFLIAIEKIN